MSSSIPFAHAKELYLFDPINYVANLEKYEKVAEYFDHALIIIHKKTGERLILSQRKLFIRCSSPLKVYHPSLSNVLGTPMLFIGNCNPLEVCQNYDLGQMLDEKGSIGPDVCPTAVLSHTGALILVESVEDNRRLILSHALNSSTDISFLDSESFAELREFMENELERMYLAFGLGAIDHVFTHTFKSNPKITLSLKQSMKKQSSAKGDNFKSVVRYKSMPVSIRFSIIE